MTGNDLQQLANVAQIASLPIAILALLLQITTWFVPNPLSSRFLTFIYNTRPLLSYIVVAAASFWLGSSYFSNELLSSITPQSTDFLLILVTIIVILTIIFTGSVRQEPLKLVRVQRQALIDTGIRLIRSAKHTVVMFGSDMSWASDYEEAIHFLTSQGKKVIVLYEINSAPIVLRNADILRKAGANLVSISSDSKIRGMLIDPYDHEDALLYTAYRKLKPSATVVKEGEKSSEQNYDYYATIYNDSLIIRAITRYYEVLQSTRI